MATSQVGGLPLFSDTTATEVTESTASGILKATSGVVTAISLAGNDATKFLNEQGAFAVPAGGGGSGSFAMLPFISGEYYDQSLYADIANWGATAVTANRLYASPIFVPNDVTISEVSINVTTGVGSALARVAIYAMGADGRPGALVWQGASTLDVSGTGEKTFTSLSIALDGGTWYYLAVASDSAISMHAANGNRTTLGYASHSTTSKQNEYYKTLGSLTLPDPFGTATGKLGGCHRVSLLVS